MICQIVLILAQNRSTYKGALQTLAISSAVSCDAKEKRVLSLLMLLVKGK